MWRADTSEYDPRMRSCHITLIWDLLKGRYVVITTYVRTSHKITICLAFPRMRNVDGYITGKIRNIWWDITSPACFDNCQISWSLRQPTTWCEFYWRAFSSRTVQREAPSLNSRGFGGRRHSGGVSSIAAVTRIEALTHISVKSRMGEETGEMDKRERFVKRWTGRDGENGGNQIARQTIQTRK